MGILVWIARIGVILSGVVQGLWIFMSVSLTNYLRVEFRICAGLRVWKTNLYCHCEMYQVNVLSLSDIIMI